MKLALRSIALPAFVLCVVVAARGQKIEAWRYWSNGLGIADTWIFVTEPEAEASIVKARWVEIGQSLASSKNRFVTLRTNR